MQDLSGKDVYDVVVRLPGTLVRLDLSKSDLNNSAPALEHAVLRNRTTAPDVPAEAALRLMLSRGERRRAVIDQNGRLVGLLALKRRLSGFCSDADVDARTNEGSGGAGALVVELKEFDLYC